MPSGVMSTRDRMLARAGLEDGTLEEADWPEGVVGVTGAGRAGLAAERDANTASDEFYYNGHGSVLSQVSRQQPITLSV